MKTTYCVLNQGVAPEELLQGEDVAWWRAFETQGAMVIRLQDGWDFLDDTSALCDLSWIGSKSSSFERSDRIINFFVKICRITRRECSNRFAPWRASIRTPRSARSWRIFKRARGRMPISFV